MDWNDLRYLLALHRRGSLARAAADLGVTKATVSRRLDALEAALGGPVAQRHASGLVLTELGKEAVRTAEAMELAARTLERSLAPRTDDVSGVVRFTAPPWLAERLIIPALSALRERHPALEVRLIGTNDVLDLANRAADLALRNVVPAAGPLVCKRTGELAGCMYGSDLYLDRRGTPKTRDELLQHDLVAYEGRGGMPGFEWLADAPYRDHVVFRAGDPVGLSSAIASGLGIGAIPCVVGETQPGLRRLDALGVGFSPLYLVTHEELRDVQRIRVVMQLVADVLRANESVLMGRGETPISDDA